MIVASVPAPVTTWLLVRTWPLASMTTPEPCASLWPDFTVMDTTLGATASAVAVQSGLVASRLDHRSGVAPRPWVSLLGLAEEAGCRLAGPRRRCRRWRGGRRATATAVSSVSRRRLAGWAGSAPSRVGRKGAARPEGGERRVCRVATRRGGAVPVRSAAWSRGISRVWPNQTGAVGRPGRARAAGCSGLGAVRGSGCCGAAPGCRSSARRCSGCRTTGVAGGSGRRPRWCPVGCPGGSGSWLLRSSGVAW